MIDAYSYYPYRDEVDDVHAIPISAQRNQSAPMGNTNITKNLSGLQYCLER
jgi:hypothetical protein